MALDSAFHNLTKHWQALDAAHHPFTDTVVSTARAPACTFTK
ncbi:MAG TPA: hypothetical protein VGI20_13365 [Rhizomicrobium sp.]|jgi:hypothetical protein